MIDLDRLAELEAKCSGNKWEAEHNGDGHWDLSVAGDFPIVADDLSENDALFIEAVRNSAREMIEELREYRKLKKDIDESMKLGKSFDDAVKRSVTEISLEEMTDLLLDILADQVVKHD